MPPNPGFCKFAETVLKKLDPAEYPAALYASPQRKLVVLNTFNASNRKSNVTCSLIFVIFSIDQSQSQNEGPYRKSRSQNCPGVPHAFNTAVFTPVPPGPSNCCGTYQTAPGAG